MSVCGTSLFAAWYYLAMSKQPMLEWTDLEQLHDFYSMVMLNDSLMIMLMDVYCLYARLNSLFFSINFVLPCRWWWCFFYINAKKCPLMPWVFKFVFIFLPLSLNVGTWCLVGQLQPWWIVSVFLLNCFRLCLMFLLSLLFIGVMIGLSILNSVIFWWQLV